MLKSNILPKKTKVISIVIVLVLIIHICSNGAFQIKSYAAQTTENYSSSKINSYPGYKELINNLKSKYPNWQFKILYTGLDWNQVIKNETTAVHGRNLISNTKSGAWICSTCGDKAYDNGSWRCASESTVSYYMDPRNWINEDYIFQFENLAYDASTQNITGVNKIISAAPWMQGNSITYTKTDGTTATINKSYAQIIMEAAQEAKISPYHLAARIVQEQGTKSTASSTASGTYSGYVGYYNYCNIGATGNSSSAVISNALANAKSKGWTDPETSIKGGASFIAQSYISVGQSTLYLQKFDVDNSDGKLYYHQYMANVSAAATESSTVRNSYKSLGILNNNFTFIIPVYENMPDTVCSMPDNSTIVTQNVKVKGTNVRLRKSQSTDLSNIVATLNNGDELLRIECASSALNGVYWDKVVLTKEVNGVAAGTKGYISRSYIEQVNDITNCEISAVANTSVNIRNGPGTDGTTVVTTLTSGQSVTIIEKGVYNNLNNYNWVRVKLSNGIQGYIADKYLTENGNNNNTGNNTNNYKTATIKCDNGSSVRLRASATTSSASIRSLSKGTTVTVIQENVANANGYTWDKIVTSDGLEGYVANKYLDKSSNGNNNDYVLGDVDGDGEITPSDYVLIKNSIMDEQNHQLSQDQKRRADYDQDGEITPSDYVLIKNKLME